MQPGLSWRASAQRQMALAGVPARYNKSFSLIRQYSPTFASTFPAVASRHLLIRFYIQFTHLKVFYCYFRSSFFKYEIICSFLGVFRGILIVFKESEISAGAPVCAAFCSMCFVRLVVASRNLFIRFYLQL
jgi:hypothetical protein